MVKLPRLVFVLVLLTMTGAALAQDVPDAVNDALADLSRRKGATIQLDDLANWTWEQRFFADASLGCPAPGQVYAQVRTNGYIFTFTDYDNVTYDYRVSADRQTVVLCINGQPAAESQVLPSADPTPTPAPAAAAACDFEGAHAGYLLPRVGAGASARVSADGVPNNVRISPTTGAEVVTQIPAGAEFQILEGPRCGEGMVWWRVQYQSRTGWTAEGKDDAYWVEPSGAAPPLAAPAEAEIEMPVIISTQYIGDLGELAVFRYDYPATSPILLEMDLVIFGTEDGAIHLLRSDTGEPHATFPAEEGNPSAVTALAYVQPDAGALQWGEAYPLLASGTADGLVMVWDMLASAPFYRLEGHTDAITGLVFSADGTLLASGSEDGAVRLWDIATGKGLAVITAHTDAITGLSINAEGTLLVSASADGTVRLWGLKIQ
ncbi:MAG: SH3 domain-containing protein [Anaerolineae bacterium]|nr:SH3 domain-containing protein [Anaerolineae bacterium]